MITCRGYKASGPKMASKNMMNHYHRPGWKSPFNHLKTLITLTLRRQPDAFANPALVAAGRVSPPGRPVSILALDVMVAF
jgi:hypothetical protein